jgi:3-keto-5-aminohexanoate cleavage enzyme
MTVAHASPLPLIVTVAPNGARRTRRDHPAIPLTPDEIGREAARCREAGAAMIHLHVRDADGRHVLDAAAYRAAIAAVRREAGADFLIQITTEAVGIFAPGAQMAVVGEVEPEAFSVALREILPNETLEPAVAGFLAGEAARGTLIQYILYDVADLQRFEALVARGIVPREHASELLVLGRYSVGQVSAPADLLPFLAARTLDMPWGVCAFGAREAACATLAATLDGHVRVGFENNIALPGGAFAPDNGALVAAVVDAATSFGRPIATPDQARALFRAG